MYVVQFNARVDMGERNTGKERSNGDSFGPVDYHHSGTIAQYFIINNKLLYIIIIIYFYIAFYNAFENGFTVTDSL